MDDTEAVKIFVEIQKEPGLFYSLDLVLIKLTWTMLQRIAKNKINTAEIC
jgi:hypothetical protein